MLSIPLDIRAVAFLTERGHPIPARRPFVAAQFRGNQGPRVPYPTFFDSGSAYCVIPYSLAVQVAWTSLRAHAVLAGNSPPVEWNGLPCQMGELEVELVDTCLQVRTGLLRVLAKVASQPAVSRLERSAILGMSFLTENHLRLELDGIGPTVAGALWVP
jgi:hypothetical protein